MLEGLLHLKLDHSTADDLGEYSYTLHSFHPARYPNAAVVRSVFHLNIPCGPPISPDLYHHDERSPPDESRRRLRDKLQGRQRWCVGA